MWTSLAAVSSLTLRSRDWLRQSPSLHLTQAHPGRSVCALLRASAAVWRCTYVLRVEYIMHYCRGVMEYIYSMYVLRVACT